MDRSKCAPIEARTLAILAMCYAVWGIAITWATAIWLPFGMALVTVSAALHSSLSHEALHGHPTRIRRLNEALVFPALSMFIPYARFRDTHLAHHNDEILTDPYDDPESNYMDPDIWQKLPAWKQGLSMFNNTLLGRLVVGPLIGQIGFMRGDWAAIMRRETGVLAGWIWHIPAVGIVIWVWAGYSTMPFWALIIATYCAISILKIRTYLEHRAHEIAKGRTVVIEDRGPLAFLFLNNNFHAVHHAHPGVAWYQLPAMFAADKACFLDTNRSYYYRSYAEVFARYFWRAKDPVPHPLWVAKDEAVHPVWSNK